ncbi:GNAT family N-acetyltransferase [Silicimonas sp. MF1-12-2]|uniref:GNAT family N-acetyltransferase n=1 Tax=Silicimonas sp. MF1-12-2 TaxID=3384793 RepID=UPI0039B3FDDD
MFFDPDNLAFRNLQPGDAGWLIQRHAELYAECEGFDSTFEVFVAQIMIDYMTNHDPEIERFWIVESGDHRLGSICCAKSDEPGVAKLRLFLIEPAARGYGLGRQLIEDCLVFATECGYSTMRLWTFESLVVACALYAKHGFECVSSKRANFFGADRVEQVWERPLG